MSWPALRRGLMDWLVGSATQVAFLDATWVSWPSGENGAVMMRCEVPLLAIDAMSYTRSPPAPSAAYRYSPRTAGGMIVCLGEPRRALLVLREPVGICVAMQVAPDDGLGFVPLGHLHGLDVLLLAEPRVEAD